MILSSPPKKFPSIPHLPWSPNLQNDDKKLSDDHLFRDNTALWITEKLDGENTTMYRDHIHARSVDSGDHPSRHWVKNLWNQIRWSIPANMRVCGENMYAKHSIYYPNLRSYFYVFGVWEDDLYLSSVETLKFISWLRRKTGVKIQVAPSIGVGMESWHSFETDATHLEYDAIVEASYDTIEGYVVRDIGEIPLDEFHLRVAKYVRQNHVQTDEHWMSQAVQPNGLVNDGSSSTEGGD